MNLKWLLRLRWGAIAGQIVVYLLAVHGFGLDLHSLPFLAIASCAIATNVLLEMLRDLAPKFCKAITANVLVLDVVLLTALLYFYGGQANPFSTMYLVHVILAALFLGTYWTWVIFGLSSVAFASLFVWHVPIPELEGHHGSGSGFGLHLQGMLVAFLLIAALLSACLTRLTEALRLQAGELDKLRARAANEQKLLALTTLAAGAAHELSTPLATIAVAAHEMAHAIQARDGNDPLLEDALLIREETKRCEAVLRSMSAQSGTLGGEMPEKCRIQDLLGEAVEPFGVSTVRTFGDAIDETMVTFPHSMVTALRTLVKNALEASGEGQAVDVEVSQGNGEIAFCVRDRGTGMSPEVKDRLGEPFFSTKPPGRGMGLGLFLVKHFVQNVGGKLVFDSVPGRGTAAVLSLPKFCRAVS